MTILTEEDLKELQERVFQQKMQELFEEPSTYEDDEDKYQVAWEVDVTAEWYKDQPKNRNFLNPIGFKLKLELFEGVDFFCQSGNVPDISMPYTEVPTRFRSLPILPGGGVSFSDFNVRFIIDEDLKNYISIHNWLRRNGRADEDIQTPGDPEFSNGILEITTSNLNVSFIVEFYNLFPISLSNMQFDATLNDAEYLTADVTFKYQQFFIRDKNFKIL